MINFPILSSTRIKNSNLKETDFHFHAERVQSRSKNTETFDATVELKSLIENGASVIRNNQSRESIDFSREMFIGNWAKKISKTKISFCAMKLIKKEVNKKKLQCK